MYAALKSLKPSHWKVLINKAAMHSLSQQSNGLSVQCANSLADLQWVIKPHISNWVRPVAEIQWYDSANLTSSFFIGEMNGERVSSISLVKHSDKVAFACSYYVDQTFRGMGYGRKTIEAIFSSDIVCKYHLYGYSIPELQDFYNETMGLNPGWLLRRYRLYPHTVKEKLPYPASFAITQPTASLANVNALLEYSKGMVGCSSTSTRNLLIAMLGSSFETSWAVIGSKGEVAGYLIMHKTTSFPKGGYLIRPFFAENIAIAKDLLREAISFAEKVPASISLDIPLPNKDWVDLIEELEGEQVDERVFSGNKDIPLIAHKKIFSLASWMHSFDC